MLNRRKFLRNAGMLAAPLMLQRIPIYAQQTLTHPFLSALTKTTNSCSRALVVIRLNGGNDGLNTVIPLDQYANLSNARSSIIIPQASVLPLTGTATTGLHPSLTGLQNLYNGGKVTIVQGVSYPNPNYSHFTAQDIFFSSPPANSTIPTASPAPLVSGWLGRALDNTYPGYPNNTNATDPPAINVGGSIPLLLQGPTANFGYNVPDPQALQQLVTGTSAAAPANDFGTELSFVRQMVTLNNTYSNKIIAAYNAQNTKSTLYQSNSLANQLKIVARLIGGGLTTQVYVVNHPGSFDTHASQTTVQASNLTILDNAISAFMDDITQMGKANIVTGMTFSEFGRRVQNNGSQGTDHGTAAPVIFFGAMLNGGIIGASPTIPATTTVNTQVNQQYDFRQLYTTILQKWMCTPLATAQSITNAPTAFNTPLPVFNAIALPVGRIDLTAAWDGNLALVDFFVENNSLYQSFAVERSLDGRLFEKVGTVESRDGNTTSGHYRFINQRATAAIVFYRIKALMKLGEEQQSETVKLYNSAAPQTVSIYPNPVTNRTVFVQFYQPVSSNVTMELYDDSGRRIYMDHVLPAAGRLSFKIPDIVGSFQLYVLQLSWDGNTVREHITFE